MDTTQLDGLSRLVAIAAKQTIAPDRPIVGERVFTHESGIHCHAMFKDSRAYEPFDPHRVGRSDRRFVLGSHSGFSAVRQMLEQAGIHVSRRQAKSLVPLFRGIHCNIA